MPMRNFGLFAIGWLLLCGAQSPAQPSTPTPTATFTAFPGYSADACYKAKDHDVADLCAQWRAAIAGEHAAIAGEKAVHEARRATNWSIIATILSFLSLCTVGLALWLTVQSNRIARKALIADQRAWIAVTAKPKWLRCVNSEVQLGLSVTMRNIGKSPATDIRIRCGLFIPDGRGNQPIALDGFHALRPAEVRGYTLFPGEEHSQDNIGACPLTDFNNSSLSSTGAAQIGVMITIHYQTSGVIPEPRTTVGYYLIDARHTNDFKMNLFHHAHLSIQGDNLDLEKFEGGHAT